MGRSKRAFLSLVIAAAWGCSSTPQAQDPVLTADPPVGGAEGLASGTANTEMQRAMEYITNQKYEDAKTHLEAALAEKPDHPRANYLMAVTVQALGDKAAAETFFKKSLALDPLQIDCATDLGALYLEEPSRPDDAIAVLKPAAEKAPDSFEVHTNLAYAYSLKKDYANASKAYDLAFAKKEDADLRFYYATMLADANEPAKATEQLHKALAATKDPALAAKIGHWSGKVGDWSGCASAFDVVIAAKPEADFYVRRGLCKHGAKDEPGARSDYEAATKADPKYATAYYYLGLSYADEKKSRTSAVAALEQAAKLGGTTDIAKKAKDKLKELAKQKP